MVVARLWCVFNGTLIFLLVLTRGQRKLLKTGIRFLQNAIELIIAGIEKIKWSS